MPGAVASRAEGREATPKLPLGTRTDWIRRGRELEALLRPSAPSSSGRQNQQEVAYMRSQVGEDRRAVDVTYAVHPPYAFARISFSDADRELRYLALEPTLRGNERSLIPLIRKRMESLMTGEEIPISADTTTFGESAELREYLQKRYLETLDLYDIAVPDKRRPVLFYYVVREFIGLGRADTLLRDPYLEDVSCLGPRVPLYVFHRVFGSLPTNVVFDDELELNRYVFRLAQVSGKHISIYQPILDATLRDGSRINLTLGTEVTRGGSTFSIRKFTHDPVTPIDLLRYGSVSPATLAYFWTLVENHRSVLISGGTASGKTTLLNAICMFIRPEDKVVSIEDTAEIHLDHQNWIQSVARTGYGMAPAASGVSGASGISAGPAKGPGTVNLFDLLVAALRQRPEYVIVGEVRGAESFTLFQAISVGHASMSTIHAGSIGELLHRVENEPMNIPRVLFQALDAVAFPALVTRGGMRLRRLTSVSEILEVDAATSELLTNDVYRWDPALDSFAFLGRSFVLEKIGKASGRTSETLSLDLDRKTRYLELMDRLGIAHYKDVSQAIAAYYLDPGRELDLLERRAAR